MKSEFRPKGNPDNAFRSMRAVRAAGVENYFKPLREGGANTKDTPEDRIAAAKRVYTEALLELVTHPDTPFGTTVRAQAQAIIDGKRIEEENLSQTFLDMIAGTGQDFGLQPEHIDILKEEILLGENRAPAS